MAEHPHFSIGEVLALLQDEFPDITISKIRFLESQGLLEPERTPSGYRKFYDQDISRLRWILIEQRDHFLPLRVIKERLDESGDELPPLEPPPTDNTVAATLFESRPDVAQALESPTKPLAWQRPRPSDGPDSDDLGENDRPVASSPESVGSTGTTPAVEPATEACAGEPIEEPGPATSSTPEPEPAPQPPAPGPGPAEPAPKPVVLPPEVSPPAPDGSFTRAELLTASGLDEEQLEQLERFGLVVARVVGLDTVYDGEAVEAASHAAALCSHGLEPRHLRMYKVAVEREAALFGQIVTPLTRQRNDPARQRAEELLGDLVEHGSRLRELVLGRELRGYLGPR
ncbi:MAG: MerR family transcriptional regulator [Actinomycetia bacterium]|nr:MerR family transcriptional regulator [Actinomycetes bacterium]